MSTQARVNIYEFNEDGVKTWIASHDRKGANDVMLQNVAQEDIPEPTILTDEHMGHLMHTGYDGEEKDNPVTFRARLQEYIGKGDKFPMHFACSEI